MPANPRQSMIASFQCFDSINAPLDNSKKFANQLPPSILALDSKTSGLGRFFGSQGIGDMRQIGHFIARFRQLFGCIQSLVAKRFRRENLPPAAGLSSPPLPVRVLGLGPFSTVLVWSSASHQALIPSVSNMKAVSRFISSSWKRVRPKPASIRTRGSSV